jgi:Prophage CP4-57 regulatory protein (AlpA)
MPTLPAPEPPVLRVIRRREVMRRTGYSGTTLWRKEKAGEFPQSVQLGPMAAATTSMRSTTGLGVESAAPAKPPRSNPMKLKRPLRGGDPERSEEFVLDGQAPYSELQTAPQLRSEDRIIADLEEKIRRCRRFLRALRTEKIPLPLAVEMARDELARLVGA